MKVGKGKCHPTTGQESPEAEYRYSCTLSLTSTLDGEGSQRHVQAALPPSKVAVPTAYEDGWAPGAVCSGAENLAPNGI